MAQYSQKLAMTLGQLLCHPQCRACQPPAMHAPAWWGEQPSITEDKSLLKTKSLLYMGGG